MKVKIFRLPLLGIIFFSTLSFFYQSCTIPCEFSSDAIIGTWVQDDGKMVTFNSDGQLIDDDFILTDASTTTGTVAKTWSVSSFEELIIAEEMSGNINYKTYTIVNFDCGYLTLETSSGNFVTLNQ